MDGELRVCRCPCVLQIQLELQERPIVASWGAWYEGLEVDLLNELGRRAGFTYSIIVHDWGNITDYETALQERMEMQDMITFAYWFITPFRMAMGAYSPYGFLDSMLFATIVPPASWLRTSRSADLRSLAAKYKDTAENL
eukprot:Skav230852  [mRNA]  locus=scaffold3471:277229:281486:+ [translate_table: standard]